MNAATALWYPDQAQIENLNITNFTRRGEEETDRIFSTYADLHQWSISEPEEFWACLWRYLDIAVSEPWRLAYKPAQRMRDASFFKGAKLNFAENLLRGIRDKNTVIVFRDEAHNRFELSGQELIHQVAASAAGLRNAGVVPGDRVAGFVPNHPATLVAMLAATSIGAIWSSCSPDFGISGVLDRFGQTQPKVLFAADGYRYNGKVFDSLARVREIAASISSIELTVVFPNLEPALSLGAGDEFVSMQEFQVETEELMFEQLPFDHPVFILYTSGTTGVPKCIVHRAGGAELLSKVVFKHLSQAATWFDSVTSIPSLNFTPLMTLPR